MAATAAWCGWDIEAGEAATVRFDRWLRSRVNKSASRSRSTSRRQSPTNLIASDECVVDMSLTNAGIPTRAVTSRGWRDAAAIFQGTCTTDFVPHLHALWTNTLGKCACGDEAKCARHDCQFGCARDHREHSLTALGDVMDLTWNSLDDSRTGGCWHFSGLAWR